MFQKCFILLSVLISYPLYSQDKPGNIGTLMFFRQGHPLSFPAIELNGDENLELRFDLFGSNQETFYYTLVLCDYDWTPVQLDKDEYLKGFQENSLQAFAASVNTTVDYVHYRLDIPNDDIEFLISGNYLLKVYRQNEPERPIISERFIVYEPEIDVLAGIDEFSSAQMKDRQELNIDVDPGEFSIHNLAGNIKLMVLQNNDWNTSRFFENYNTDSRQHLMFNIPGQIVFPGVSEYRWFDMKSLKFLSERVDYIEYHAPYYNIYLKPDKMRGSKGYFKNADFNGLYFIGNQDSHDKDTLDADYALVHFQLQTDMPLPADVFIEGALTGWKHDDNYMLYNPDKGVYEKTLFLKQGLYNYRFSTHEYNTDFFAYDITEGSYYETSNMYLVVIYFRPLGEKYFKPSGFTLIE